MSGKYNPDDDRTERADDRYYAWCTSEWVGMPEYYQEELRPWNSVQVNFTGREDMEAFGQLIGADITPKTRSVWYPPIEEMQVLGHLRYIDEANLELEEGPAQEVAEAAEVPPDPSSELARNVEGTWNPNDALRAAQEELSR